jgi:dihydropteroate synthase
VQQNFALLARQSELLPLGYAVLAGWSRKSSLLAVTQTSLAAMASMDMQERVVPSVAAAMLAVQNGAAIVRVHDVRQTVQALRVLAATHAAGKPVA